MGISSQKIIELDVAQQKLSTLWFLLSGLLVLIFIIFSFTDKFEGKHLEAWGWLLPSFLPTLTLMIGVQIANVRVTGEEKPVQMKNNVFKIAYRLSIVYLSLIVAIILVHPFMNMGFFDVFKVSGVFLAPIQGLVTATIGGFFSMGRHESNSK